MYRYRQTSERWSPPRKHAYRTYASPGRRSSDRTSVHPNENSAQPHPMKACPRKESRHEQRFCVGSAPDSWGVWFPDDPTADPLHTIPRRGIRVGIRMDRTRTRSDTFRPIPAKLTDELARPRPEAFGRYRFRTPAPGRFLGCRLESDQGRRQVDRSRRRQARSRHPRDVARPFHRRSTRRPQSDARAVA